MGRALQAASAGRLGLAAELGDRPSAPATVELADDPALGSFQAAAVAPHRHRSTSSGCSQAVGVDERLDSARGMVADQAELLEARSARVTAGA